MFGALRRSRAATGAAVAATVLAGSVATLNATGALAADRPGSRTRPPTA